eukprot:gene170-5956_t
MKATAWLRAHDIDPFVSDVIYDEQLLRRGKSWPVAFLNKECCFHYGPRGPREDALWRSDVFGVLQTVRSVLTRCMRQLEHVKAND